MLTKRTFFNFKNKAIFKRFKRFIYVCGIVLREQYKMLLDSLKMPLKGVPPTTPLYNPTLF